MNKLAYSKKNKKKRREIAHIQNTKNKRESHPQKGVHTQ
jgi:hypothetical protein